MTVLQQSGELTALKRYDTTSSDVVDEYVAS